VIGNILSGDQAVAPGGPFGDDLVEGINEPVDVGNAAAHADACPYCTAMAIMTSQLVNERMSTERSIANADAVFAAEYRGQLGVIKAFDIERDDTDPVVTRRPDGVNGR
jgi:hypothetical protein